jgi:hypothetical protein
LAQFTGKAKRTGEARRGVRAVPPYSDSKNRMSAVLMCRPRRDVADSDSQSGDTDMFDGEPESDASAPDFLSMRLKSPHIFSMKNVSCFIISETG